MTRIKRILSLLFAYVTVVGIVTFTLFIHEEAIQMIMFGTWPAKNAKQWHIVKEGIDLMDSTNTSSRWINRIVGWVQPLAFLSYRAFNKSTDYYMESIRAETFANAPQLFIGETMEFSVQIRSVNRTEDGKYSVQSGKLFIIFEQEPKLGETIVTAKIMKDERTGKLYGIVD